MSNRYFGSLCCLLVGLLVASVGHAQDRDDYDHLIEINMASLTMLVEEGQTFTRAVGYGLQRISVGPCQ